MKPFLIVLLSFSILLNGCTSFYPLTCEERAEGLPDADDSVLVILQDGRSIRAEPHHHINVTEPSDFLYGVGDKGGISIFRGKLLQSVIDTSTVTVTRGGIICWLKDGTTIFFKENDYVEVTSDGGTGFWCVGEYEDGGLFRGKVSDENIQGFQIRKTDVVKTALLTAPFVGIVVAIVVYVSTFTL